MSTCPPVLRRCALGLALSLAAVAPNEAHAAAPAIPMASDVRYGPHPAQRLDVVTPPTGPFEATRPAVLLVHGGGWFAGDKRRTTPLAQTLAAAGFVVFNVDYTLATRTRPGFPLQLGELRAALAWIAANADRFGADPRRLGALGTSAGGNLAALLATTAPPGSLRALVTWSAPLELTALAPGQLRGLAAVYTGCPRAGCPRAVAASPLFHVTPSMPPALLVNARRELVPAPQALRMAEALDAAGVPRQLLLVPGSLHSRELAPAATAPTVAVLRSALG